MEKITKERAEEELKKRYKKAKELLKDKEKIEKILKRTEDKLKEFPIIGEKLSYVPTMISLVKSYIEKEYTDIPIGTIIAIVSALLYLLSTIDIIPDFIPVAGYFDDIAVMGVCLKLVESDINEYKMWKKENNEI